MDHTDAQVKGIPRYLPDKLSSLLLVSSAGKPAGLYISAPQSVLSLLPNQVSTNIPLSLLALCFAIAWLISIVLILHLAFVVNHSKHRRIRHYTLHPEDMDIGNLVKRFSYVHYTLIFLIFVAGVLIGKYL